MGNSIIDLFCGSGGFSFHLATHAKKVLGVEISDEAIELAKKSAIKNQIANVQFFTGNVDHIISTLEKGLEEFDSILVNPPRRGLSEKLINFMKKNYFKFILYSSCNPESLKRDIDLLSSHFSLKEIIPFDMFPYTPHVECLVLLKLKVTTDGQT
jgi:23S rRNA (uracil1939-C5)-methyltransferase